jgi:hypothetical protein
MMSCTKNTSRMMTYKLRNLEKSLGLEHNHKDIQDTQVPGLELGIEDIEDMLELELGRELELELEPEPKPEPEPGPADKLDSLDSLGSLEGEVLQSIGGEELLEKARHRVRQRWR